MKHIDIPAQYFIEGKKYHILIEFDEHSNEMKEHEYNFNCYGNATEVQISYENYEDEDAS